MSSLLLASGFLNLSVWITGGPFNRVQPPRVPSDIANGPNRLTEHRRHAVQERKPVRHPLPTRCCWLCRNNCCDHHLQYCMSMLPPPCMSMLPSPCYQLLQEQERELERAAAEALAAGAAAEAQHAEEAARLAAEAERLQGAAAEVGVTVQQQLKSI